MTRLLLQSAQQIIPAQGTQVFPAAQIDAFRLDHRGDLILRARGRDLLIESPQIPSLHTRLSDFYPEKHAHPQGFLWNKVPAEDGDIVTLYQPQHILAQAAEPTDLAPALWAAFLALGGGAAAAWALSQVGNAQPRAESLSLAPLLTDQNLKVVTLDTLNNPRGFEFEVSGTTNLAPGQALTVHVQGQEGGPELRFPTQVMEKDGERYYHCDLVLDPQTAPKGLLSFNTTAEVQGQTLSSGAQLYLPLNGIPGTHQELVQLDNTVKVLSDNAQMVNGGAVVKVLGSHGTTLLLVGKHELLFSPNGEFQLNSAQVREMKDYGAEGLSIDDKTQHLCAFRVSTKVLDDVEPLPNDNSGPLGFEPIAGDGIVDDREAQQAQQEGGIVLSGRLSNPQQYYTLFVDGQDYSDKFVRAQDHWSATIPLPHNDGTYIADLRGYDDQQRLVQMARQGFALDTSAWLHIDAFRGHNMLSHYSSRSTPVIFSGDSHNLPDGTVLDVRFNDKHYSAVIYNNRWSLALPPDDVRALPFGRSEPATLSVQLAQKAGARTLMAEAYIALPESIPSRDPHFINDINGLEHAQLWNQTLMAAEAHISGPSSKTVQFANNELLGAKDGSGVHMPSYSDQQHSFDAVNALRSFLHLDPILPSPDLDLALIEQTTAFTMAKEQAINHDIHNFKNKAGESDEGAQNSILGSNPITSTTTWFNYFHDDYNKKPDVGHRVQLLAPTLDRSAVGLAVGENDMLYSAMAIKNIESKGIILHDNHHFIPTTEAWPAPGFFPYNLLPKKYWSLASPMTLTHPSTELEDHGALPTSDEVGVRVFRWRDFVVSDAEGHKQVQHTPDEELPVNAISTINYQFQTSRYNSVVGFHVGEHDSNYNPGLHADNRDPGVPLNKPELGTVDDYLVVIFGKNGAAGDVYAYNLHIYNPNDTLDPLLYHLPAHFDPQLFQNPLVDHAQLFHYG